MEIKQKVGCKIEPEMKHRLLTYILTRDDTQKQFPQPECVVVSYINGGEGGYKLNEYK